MEKDVTGQLRLLLEKTGSKSDAIMVSVVPLSNVKSRLVLLAEMVSRPQTSIDSGKIPEVPEAV